jgi:methyltransferase-like protein
MPVSENFIYDALPYPSFTFPQTHPDRLATLGTFYGMSPARPEKCRVLELGCGDGANLLSFAYGLPNSEFVGVDLSAVHIADAKKTAEELNLSNISFYAENVLDFTRERFGEFDFIIAHGLYSWIPDFVRQKVVEIYAECLAPQGVGYISYNAYPGCHLRAMMWDAMRFHTAELEEPLEKVQHGKMILGFLSEAVEPDSIYKMMIDLELSEINDRTEENVFHDEFAEVNQPFYFHEFINHIKPHGLQFLSEAEPFSTHAGNLNPKAQQALKSLGSDIVRREQYLDFIKCRRFRSTLVCRANIELNRQLKPETVGKYFFASHVRLTSEAPAVKEKVKERFISVKGASFEIEHPLTKAALVLLNDIWTRRLSFAELMNESRTMLNEMMEEEFAAEKRTSASLLLSLFEAGFVKLHLYQPEFATQAGEFPVASAFARWQAQHGSESVSTLTTMNLSPEDEGVRTLIQLLDGTRNRAMLADEIAARLDVEDKENFRLRLPEIIEFNLMKMAQAGLLHS